MTTKIICANSGTTYMLNEDQKLQMEKADVYTDVC